MYVLGLASDNSLMLQTTATSFGYTKDPVAADHYTSAASAALARYDFCREQLSLKRQPPLLRVLWADA